MYSRETLLPSTLHALRHSGDGYNPECQYANQQNCFDEQKTNLGNFSQDIQKGLVFIERSQGTLVFFWEMYM
jgi:hypothetical protein